VSHRAASRLLALYHGRPPSAPPAGPAPACSENPDQQQSPESRHYRLLEFLALTLDEAGGTCTPADAAADPARPAFPVPPREAPDANLALRLADQRATRTIWPAALARQAVDDYIEPARGLLDHPTLWQWPVTGPRSRLDHPQIHQDRPPLHTIQIPDL
jgi:hypothetical protein